MRRAVIVAAVVALATAACSVDDDVGGSSAGTEPDPVTTFCADWVRFDALTNSDDDPTEQLVLEVLDLQDEMEAVLPDGLESEWASILEWNRTFIEYFQTVGYVQPSDQVFFDLLGGEDAAAVAGQDREDAYETIQTWSRRNCSTSSGADFCELWPVYDDYIESNPDPNEELVAQLLEMQDDIDAVLPLELTTDWAGIVDWNQAFIDVFEQVGYGPVTSETFEQAFGGDDEVATAAEDALENGFGAIREWTAANCTDGSEHASTFCANWEEFAALTADEDRMTPESYDEGLAMIDRIGDDVPAEVRSGWNAVVESTRGFHDVLVSVNFEPSRITDDLLEQAFGSVDAAVATEQAADEGRAAIEQWALTGCGDFCSRWPELRQALDETGTHDLGWVVDMGDDEGFARLYDHLRALEVGSRLVPDEIHDQWDLAVDARRDWVAWWEEFDFNGGQLQIIEVQDETNAARELAVETMRGADYLVDDRHADLGLEELLIRVLTAWQDDVDEPPAWLLSSLGNERELAEIAAWLNGSGDPPEWLLHYWLMGPSERVNFQLSAAIDGWVSDNCETVSGRPGTVAARYPRIEDAAGDTLVLALMLQGATLRDLTDPAVALTGDCQDIGRDPWGTWPDEEGREERWEGEPFRAERWDEGGWCDYRWEEGPARLDAGTYTMLAAVIEGRPSGNALGTPSACLAFDVVVDGDSVIDVPTLPPCDVDLGRSDDPWRNPPPVDATTPGAGTLQIVIPDLVGDREGGEVILVVLPAGTSLNDVGREQVWPVGATRTWLIDEGTIQEGRIVGEVAVPVAELPAAGSARTLEPHWLAENPPTDRLPLAVLAPGSYEVHVQVMIPDSPEQDESERAKNDRCGSFEVTIAGDTVVDLPELGECPRVP